MKSAESCQVAPDCVDRVDPDVVLVFFEVAGQPVEGFRVHTQVIPADPVKAKDPPAAGLKSGLDHGDHVVGTHAGDQPRMQPVEVAGAGVVVGVADDSSGDKTAGHRGHVGTTCRTFPDESFAARVGKTHWAQAGDELPKAPGGGIDIGFDLLERPSLQGTLGWSKIVAA